MKFSAQYGLVFDIHVPYKNSGEIYEFSVIGKTFENALELAKKVADQYSVLDKLDWEKAAPPEPVSFCSNCGRFHKKSEECQYPYGRGRTVNCSMCQVILTTANSGQVDAEGTATLTNTMCNDCEEKILESF